jgi:hypothetical protein
MNLLDDENILIEDIKTSFQPMESILYNYSVLL